MLKQDAAFRGVEPRYVFLADLVDKGPESCLAASLAHAAIEHNPGSLLLLGNHDVMFRNFLRGTMTAQEAMWWKRNGLKSTLKSYYVPEELLDDPSPSVLAAAREHVVLNFSSHVDVLEKARTSFEIDRYWLAHAGVRPGRPLADQAERDLLWIRGDFLDHEGEFGAIVVHGHSPTLSEHPEVYPNRIAVDTGAYATGRLTASVLADGDPEFISVFWNGSGVELERRTATECMVPDRDRLRSVA